MATKTPTDKEQVNNTTKITECLAKHRFLQKLGNHLCTWYRPKFPRDELFQAFRMKGWNGSPKIHHPAITK